MASSGTELSVVIPIYNEEDNIVPLLEELFPILRNTGKTFEVLCVDDASSDKSLSVLNGQKKKFPELRIIRHTINSGESAAGATGFANAEGRVIITIDGDQQNDPADIPELLKTLESADAVCGVRRKREDDWVKRISSRVANRFRNKVTGDEISDAGCTFRALKAGTLREIPSLTGCTVFFPHFLGFRDTRLSKFSSTIARGRAESPNME
jgi:dolichol-phosphate mannosyltransferase